jgi:hypothetical protein
LGTTRRLILSKVNLMAITLPFAKCHVKDPIACRVARCCGPNDAKRMPGIPSSARGWAASPRTYRGNPPPPPTPTQNGLRRSGASPRPGGGNRVASALNDTLKSQQFRRDPIGTITDRLNDDRRSARDEPGFPR